MRHVSGMGVGRRIRARTGPRKHLRTRALLIRAACTPGDRVAIIPAHGPAGPAASSRRLEVDLMSRVLTPPNRTPRSFAPTFARRGLGLTVAGFVALASVPALAAPPEDGAAADSTKGEVGGTVSLLVFDGDPDAGNTLRYAVQTGLSERGYTVVGVKQTASVTASKVKCKTLDDACRAKIGQYLTKNSKTPPDFYAYGYGGAGGETSKIVLYDIKADKTVQELEFVFEADSDMIAPLTIPKATAAALADYQDPPAPMTAEEKKIIAELDEPEMTEEEKKAQEKKLKEAQEESLRAYNQGLDVGAQAVDLKKDFDKVCRKKAEPRKDTKIELPDGSVEVEKDLRPVCERGPAFGYWQPRAYVALSLTAAGAIATGVMYGLAAGARSSWNDAKDALDSAGGDSLNDPGTGNPTRYGQLAGEVSAEAQRVRNFALGGDIALGATVVLGGVLGIMIWQDRQAAKDFLQRERELNISNLRVAPTADPVRGNYGMGASFQF